MNESHILSEYLFTESVVGFVFVLFTMFSSKLIELVIDMTGFCRVYKFRHRIESVNVLVSGAGEGATGHIYKSQTVTSLMQQMKVEILESSLNMSSGMGSESKES